jgi:predicted O-linked N-acetylglucosamine transferase (SPINDLY family)
MLAMNPSLQTVLQQAIQAFQGGNFDEANFILQAALQNDINNADAVFELGIAYAKANRLIEASDVFRCLQAYKNNDVRIPYNLGLIHSLQGKHQLALAAYDLALYIQPDDAEVLVNKGSTYIDIKNYLLALEVLEKATQIRPDIPEAWSNKGVALNNLNSYQESIDAYNEAIKLMPNYHEAWSNKSVPLTKLRRFPEAFEACDEALRLKPDYAEGWSNKGNTLNELKRYDAAITHYDKALSLDPEFAGAWSNKGMSLYELKRYDEAITHFDKALSLDPEFAVAWSNKGNTLNELKRYDEAIAHYDQALSLKNDIDWLYGALVKAKLQICCWSDLKSSVEILSKKIMADEKVTSPFPLLALTDDAFLHKKSSQIYIQDKYPFNPVLGPILKRPKNEKIRIGYFSADFKNHPVAFLIAELFELHDRSQFEIYGFSLVNAADEMRERLKLAFDHFIEVGRKSDIEVAQLCRSLTIDIAIDLTGFTQDARTGIFAHRAAPLQVNYLGYPGTMGADYIDYIIADKTLISPELQSCYSEKVVYLPNSYQVNDRKRLISDRQFTRQELGLPENGFVFCCFNNNYKILPATFEGWMRILKVVEGSVLWLLQDNFWAAQNLKKEAEKLGIAADRLVFAERMPLPDHLARHRQADLFLDTFPYNAHTTTSDALWADLPVLTLTGQSFASRVAASLLNAIGLPELITNTQEEYEALVIELALNPKKLADIKLRLASNRLTAPLFDTPLFTKNLENAYIKMVERYRADFEPEHISIA